jgi:hypothetical protein
MPQGPQRRKYQFGADIHYQVGPPPLNVGAAQQSCLIDAADDREWFARHPHATMRERPASEREIQANGLEKGATAAIFRRPTGEHIRLLLNPSRSK